MPKKKKKSRASQEGAAPTKSNNCEKQPIVTPIGDAISVRLLKGPKVGKALKYTPTVTLHETDAVALDVISGDRVFVISGCPSESSSPLALAKVRVLDGSDERSKSSPFGRKNKKVELTRGNCFLSPSSLEESFFEDQTPLSTPLKPTEGWKTPPPKPTPSSSKSKFSFAKGDGGDQIIASPPPSNPTPSSSKSKFSFAKGGGGDQLIASPPPSKATPSSSKSKFSFAKGGGGDQLISPTHGRTMLPSTPSTPSSIQSKKGQTQRPPQLHIVPLDSDMGDSLAAMFCRKADTMVVRRCPFLEEEEASLSSSHIGGPLHERLIVAHTAYEYLTEGTIFPVSICGQTVRCQLETISSIAERTTTTCDAESKEDDDTYHHELVAGIERLSIHEDHDPVSSNAIMKPATPVVSKLEDALRSNLSILDDTQRRNMMLYEVNMGTKVEFSVGDTLPSPAKQSSVQEVSVQKPMVAGLDETIGKVEAALETPLAHPELFHTSSSNSTSLRPPKGILLYGPSGIGKSSLALQVGQSLESKGTYHVERIHCTSLQSQTSFVGAAESRLVKIFSDAQKPRPGKKGCLLILDDIHLICPRREGIDLGADRLASTLLALLDGMNSGGRPSKHTASGKTSIEFYPTIILAITTNPGSLDAALRRPGRLDSEIEVPLPDEPSTRLKILKFQLESLSKKPNFSDPEWMSLARLAKGFTGADLKLAAKEALRNTLLLPKGERTITLPILQKAILATKPSAIKAVTVEVPSVPWSSIGGMDDVKKQLRDAIELPLTHGETFRRLGIRPPRGVLLYGPPGCSKTLMARALATEGHMNFLAVKGPELLSKWLGESERALAALFRRARLASPAIIFFDEVDAIASKRGGGSSSGGGERLLSQLLTELDGIQQNKDAFGRESRVVIVCATNRPDLLDGALMRPGRIDRMIHVGVPDEKSRKNIIEIGLKKSNSSNIDTSLLAKQNVSGGLSGAEIIGACRDAALKAMEEFEENEDKLTDPVLTTEHVYNSLTNMERQITQENLDFYASFQGSSSKL